MQLSQYILEASLSQQLVRRRVQYVLLFEVVLLQQGPKAPEGGLDLCWNSVFPDQVQDFAQGLADPAVLLRHDCRWAHQSAGLQLWKQDLLFQVDVPVQDLSSLLKNVSADLSQGQLCLEYIEAGIKPAVLGREGYADCVFVVYLLHPLFVRLNVSARPLSATSTLRQRPSHPRQ